MLNEPDVPSEIVDRVAAICLALPETTLRSDRWSHAFEIRRRIFTWLISTVDANGSNVVSIVIDEQTSWDEIRAAGGATTRDDGDVTWTLGGSPIGYHNAIVRFAAADRERAARIVAAWDHGLRQKELPGSCHLTPDMERTDLRPLLEDVGFVDGGVEPAMAAVLTASRVRPPTGLTITSVRDRRAMADYRDVLASGFGEGPEEADWVAQTFTAIGTDAGWRHYVAHVDGEAIATASLLLTLPVGGIYFVCTHPDHRRRGVGAAITRHAMSEAAEAGATHAVLGSSPMGQGVYERLGFETVFTYRLLERDA